MNYIKIYALEPHLQNALESTLFDRGLGVLYTALIYTMRWVSEEGGG